jgi:dienelactone hydrolase
VPYLALPPSRDLKRAPLVVALHMMDPPRSEAAMAAALPMAGVAAWRAYLGLPMFGERMPPGGQEEVMRLGYEDALQNLIGPVIQQAAEELPAAVKELRQQLPIDDAPIGLVGGSAGAGAALLAMAEGQIPVAAAALVNAVIRAADVVEMGERMFGVAYRWNDKSRSLADRLDFVRRADEIASSDPQPALLLVNGENDDPAFPASAGALYEALAARYASPDDLAKIRVPGLGHPLAEEPGVEPVPQTSGAVRVDTDVTNWLRRHLADRAAPAPS